MENSNLQTIVEELTNYTQETEWIEFKHNKSFKNQAIGEYISALSNSANLCNQPYAYIVWGVENDSHNIIGTSFHIKSEKEGNQELEFWLMQNLNPKIDFSCHELTIKNKKISLIKIPAAKGQPTKFKGIAYTRIGSNKTELKNYPDKERILWQSNPTTDWSIEICTNATINDLDETAIFQAKRKYKEINKNKAFYSEIDTWDNETFLDKAQITKNKQITNAALILLGKPESTHFLSPARIQITWKLDTDEQAYEHFTAPFFISVNRVVEKIRNVKYKILPFNSLLPIEVNKYDEWIILEALNNCIAHQDYSLNSRIIVTETIERLTFQNAGNFYDGTVEDYTLKNKTPDKYRNSFLADAMKNLGMIDTIGYGIKKMFQLQRARYFPLPDYNLSEPKKVILSIPGKIINENYSRLLIDKKDLDLNTIVLLDKVQKKQTVTKEEVKKLRKQKLIEGRVPNIYISSQVAGIKDNKQEYIKHKAFDTKYYKDLILEYLKEYKQASRDDIDRLVIDKLSDILDVTQKRKKINNILFAMSKKDKTIKNIGATKTPIWVLIEK